jgi:hypothetical protein
MGDNDWLYPFVIFPRKADLIPAGNSIVIASSARICDFYLHGEGRLPVNREGAAKVLAAVPHGRKLAR